MGAAGLDTEFEIGGLAVTIKNFYEGGGDVAIDIGANFFPDVGKFTDGEGTINFDDVTSTKEGDRGGFGLGRGGKEKTARRFFIESVNGANFGVFLLFLKTGLEAVNVGV